MNNGTMPELTIAGTIAAYSGLNTNTGNGKRKIDIVLTNSEKISKKIQRKYETLEQKDLVKVDHKNIKIEHINTPFAKIEDDIIRHDSIKVGLEIMNILLK